MIQFSLESRYIKINTCCALELTQGFHSWKPIYQIIKLYEYQLRESNYLAHKHSPKCLLNNVSLTLLFQCCFSHPHRLYFLFSGCSHGLWLFHQQKGKKCVPSLRFRPSQKSKKATALESDCSSSIIFRHTTAYYPRDTIRYIIFLNWTASIHPYIPWC